MEACLYLSASPLAWINALPLSQCSEQAGAEIYGGRGQGGWGAVGATLECVCVCAPLVVREGQSRHIAP